MTRRTVVTLMTCAVGAVALLPMGCQRQQMRAPVPPPVEQDGKPRLESLGVPVYPEAKLAAGESAVRAPIPGGEAYMFRYRVMEDAERPLAFYERHLQAAHRVQGVPPIIAGRSRFGDAVTVVPDTRTIILNRHGKKKTIQYTDILITVRRIEKAY